MQIIASGAPMPCARGYDEFIFFKENEEYRPFDGCKTEIQDTFTKYIFWFFEPFFARLASKFEKSTNMTFKKNFREKIKKVSKNAEFHADFKSVEQVVKKCTKKSYN